MNRFLKIGGERTGAAGTGRNGVVCRRLRDPQPRSRGQALEWTRKEMARLGLGLNEAKTSSRDARRERFEFLGYTSVCTISRTATGISGRAHRRKACSACKARSMSSWLPRNMGAWHEVRDRLNRLVARLGRVLRLRPAPWPIVRSMDTSITRPAVPAPATRCRSSGNPSGGVRRPRRCCARTSWRLAEGHEVKPVGKPDAGNPHVRFDERGWETERCRRGPNRARPGLYLAHEHERAGRSRSGRA